MRFPSPSGTICSILFDSWFGALSFSCLVSQAPSGQALPRWSCRVDTASELRHREASSLAACRAPLGGKDRPPTRRRLGLLWFRPVWADEVATTMSPLR